MTYFAGKNLTLKVGNGGGPETFTVVAAAKSHSITVNQAPIDVTNKDGNQWKALIDGGIKSMTVNVQGIMTDDATIKTKMMALAIASGGTSVANFQIVSALGDTFTGPFFVSSVDRAGSVADAETYTFKLESSGTIVYVAAT